MVAHAFASAGIPTVVLEAGAIARGSTAASSALLLQEPDLELTQLTARYGSRAGRRVWELGRDSVRGLVALLKRLKVECDLNIRDAIYYARDADGAERLRREFALRRRARFGAEWLTAGKLRNMTGIPARAAIRTRGNAQFDPYRASVGVLGSAVDAGAQVFERSQVRRIDVTRTGVCVRTAGGLSTPAASSSRPAMPRASSVRWQGGFGCIGPTSWQPNGSARNSGMSSVFPT
jgi:glycine/D-amino acid oxidase-like deaminating enzyme